MVPSNLELSLNERVSRVKCGWETPVVAIVWTISRSRTAALIWPGVPYLSIFLDKEGANQQVLQAHNYAPSKYLTLIPFMPP